MIGTLLLSVLVLIFFRIIYLIQFKSKNKFNKKSAKTLIVIGSGGHTHEMVRLVKNLNPELYNPRSYVMADTDLSSENKIIELEQSFVKNSVGKYQILKIPRSRSVNQSLITSVVTTCHSILYSIPLILKMMPDLILCNGPGTCIPVCLIAFLVNTFVFSNIKIVFVESFCRVKSLSLSGKILLYLADVIIVQWPDLLKKYPNAVFLGRLA